MINALLFRAGAGFSPTDFEAITQAARPKLSPPFAKTSDIRA
jgi:hypothetical protein